MTPANQDKRIYTIKLLFEAYCEEPLTEEQQKQFLIDSERIYEIIEYSLYGYDILAWYIKGSHFVASIRTNEHQSENEKTVKEDITRNYGDDAIDGWMNSDTTLGQYDEDEYVSLSAALVSIKKGDQLSRKRHNTDVEKRGRKKKLDISTNGTIDSKVNHRIHIYSVVLKTELCYLSLWYRECYTRTGDYSKKLWSTRSKIRHHKRRQGCRLACYGAKGPSLVVGVVNVSPSAANLLRRALEFKSELLRCCYSSPC